MQMYKKYHPEPAKYTVDFFRKTAREYLCMFIRDVLMSALQRTARSLYIKTKKRKHAGVRIRPRMAPLAGIEPATNP